MNEPIMRWLAARWTDPHDHQRGQEPELWLLAGVALVLTVLITALNVYTSSL